MYSLGLTYLLILVIIRIQSCDSNEFKIRRSVYTKSCPEGRFIVQKLSFGMKIPRYQFLINQSTSLQKLLQSKVKSKWYRLIDADFEVNFPKISSQTSHIMVYKALQQYSALTHFLIQKTNGKPRRDLKSISKEIPKLMCSVEGLINGMHALQRKYKFISEKDMEIWLENTFNNYLSPLAISKELIQNFTEFNEIILEVTNQRLKILKKHKRLIKLRKLKELIGNGY